MKAGKEYKRSLWDRLKNKSEAEAYLNAALNDDDPRVFFIALRDVAASQGNMSLFAKQCQIHRASLYKMTSKNGNPSMESVMNLLKCIGLRIRLESKKHQRLAA